MKIESAALYITDNGAILCGSHLGASARTTGRDISGQRIELVTDAHAAEWRRMANSEIQCEQCGKEHARALAPDMSEVWTMGEWSQKMTSR